MCESLKYFCIILFLFTGSVSFAQIAPHADTLREFQIIRGPSMRSIKIDSVTTLQSIAGGAIIKQGSTTFHSDSAVVNLATHVLEAFGNIEINQADTIHTYSQYLKYLGVEKIAYLKNKVRLTNKTGTLHTEDLDYNLQTGIGNFHNGGRVVEGKSVITSLEGTYYDDTKDIYFKKNVKLDEPQKHIRADSLLYNMQTRKSNFISPTNIKTPEVEINTTQGTYDLNTGNAFFTSRTTVKDSSNRLYSANTMALENKSGNAQLEGNAVIIDSAGGYTIIANQVFLNKQKNSFLATRKPVLIIKQKHDSTYVAADTIFSGFTSYVKNENEILKNDSVINVNFQQNDKVNTLIENDSTHMKPTSDTGLNRRELIPSAPDTSQKKLPAIIKPDVADTTISVAHDSSQTKITNEKDSLLMMDSTINQRREEKMDSSAIDSAQQKMIVEQKDSSHNLQNIKKDSSNRSDSVRYFLAFHRVKIFNDSLQSICDSMFISSRDSVFRLYYDPVVWSGNTQIAGDTLFLFTKNKEPLRLYVFESGIIVNRTREGFFNQMAGKTINGYFVNGKIDYVRVKGTQSESIYYLQDEDSAYIGMNRATGDVIDLYFKNDDLKKVLFVNQIQGKMYPMNQIPEDQRRLKTFKWLDDKRPKNRAELFE